MGYWVHIEPFPDILRTCNCEAAAAETFFERCYEGREEMRFITVRLRQSNDVEGLEAFRS